MEIEEYVAGVRFRLGPTDVRAPWKQLFALASPEVTPRVRFLIESLATSLPEGGHDSRSILSEISSVPRMSTFAIAAIINKSVKEMNEGHAFLNVGVWNGFTFLAGLAGNPHKICIGVDNFSGFGGPRSAFLQRFARFSSQHHHFFDIDFRHYMEHVHRTPIGVYFYDGAHDYASQFDGLELAAPFFAKNCLIMVDDTNRPSPRKATIDFITKEKGRYRLILDKSTTWAQNPVWWDGLMILRKVE